MKATHGCPGGADHGRLNCDSRLISRCPTTPRITYKPQQRRGEIGFAQSQTSPARGRWYPPGDVWTNFRVCSDCRWPNCEPYPPKPHIKGRADGFKPCTLSAIRSKCHAGNPVKPRTHPRPHPLRLWFAVSNSPGVMIRTRQRRNWHAAGTPYWVSTSHGISVKSVR
jgi:hypothetical protein